MQHISSFLTNQEEMDDIFRRHMTPEQFDEIEEAKGNPFKLGKILNDIEQERQQKSKDGYDCFVCNNKGGFYVNIDPRKAYTDSLYVSPEYVATKMQESVVDSYTGHSAWVQCHCHKVRATNKENERSNLGTLSKLTWTDFKHSETYQKEISLLATKHWTYGAKMGNWFLISGQSGLGKTMICSILTNALIKDGKRGRYLIYPDFVEEYKRIQLDKQTAIMDEYANVELLYIDDLFKGSCTTTDLTNMFRLINRRYASGKMTIISTEFDKRQLLEFNEAITGRILEKCGEFAHFEQYKDGKNYRMKGVK